MKRYSGLILVALLVSLLVMGAALHRWPSAAQAASVDGAAAGGFDCAAVTQIPQSECEALVTFYDATNGGAWHNRSGWLTTNTPCTWFGITCTAGHVTGLDMSGNNLGGELPGQLADLTQLKVLYLESAHWGAGLSGVIPPELGTLAHLELFSLKRGISESWSIPAQLGNLSNLRTLVITTALEPSMTGDGTLQEAIRGESPIPPQLGNLTNLEELHLNWSVSGPIPPELGNLSNLRVLNLGDNYSLSGPIPSELGNLSNLTHLDLSYPLWVCASQGVGDLTGALPAELGNLSNLQYLDLYCQSFIGPFPMTFINLDELTWLDYGAVSPATIRLCEPKVEAFQEWIAGVPDVWPSPGILCEGAAFFPMIFKAGAP